MRQGVETVRWFEELGTEDAADVGAKNASLGEMTRALRDQGVKVPEGFAITSQAYWRFLEATGLVERIASLLGPLRAGSASIRRTGAAIRDLFQDVQYPPEISDEIRVAYRELSRRCGQRNVAVAVRGSLAGNTSSGPPGQQAYLNVHGEEEVLDACLKCYTSVFVDRAIATREERGQDHLRVPISIGVQRMVRSVQACSGVARTWDPETGFPNVVVIESAWGLGEGVLSGTVSADRHVVFKPLLGEPGIEPIIDRHMGSKKTKMVHSETTDRAGRMVETTDDERKSYVLNDPEVLRLAQWAAGIERHYGKLMEVEWAKDGDTGELFVVQATAKAAVPTAETETLHTYHVKEPGERLLAGLGVGEGLATGRAYVIKRLEEADRFPEGGILVTGTADADWVPVIRRAAGLVTDFGGRTADGAMACREMNIPAVVGTGEATRTIRHGQEVTLSCTEGEEGFVYAGTLEFEELSIGLQDLPETRTRLMLSVGSPAAAFRWWRLPCRGIGLASMEYIITNNIKVHPMALARFKELSDRDARRRITSLTWPHEDKTEYFVSQLAHGVAKMAAAQHPQPVLVRFSDFTTAQYSTLLGARQFEPKEGNPALGLRGASRYYRNQYREGFALECRAIRRVREEFGLANVAVMIPYARTPAEVRRVLQVMGQNGLQRGSEGLQVFLMCQLPSNALLASEFARQVDGFCIATEDLAQAVLGVDREEAHLADLFEPANEAVKGLITWTVSAAHQAGIRVGVTGETVSTSPDFAGFLVEQGVDFLAVNPESLVSVKQRVIETERRLGIRP